MAATTDARVILYSIPQGYNVYNRRERRAAYRDRCAQAAGRAALHQVCGLEPRWPHNSSLLSATPLRALALARASLAAYSFSGRAKRKQRGVRLSKRPASQPSSSPGCSTTCAGRMQATHQFSAAAAERVLTSASPAAKTVGPCVCEDGTAHVWAGRTRTSRPYKGEPCCRRLWCVYGASASGNSKTMTAGYELAMRL